MDTERVPKLCFCRNQAVLGTNNCCQELSAALPSPCTTHDSQHSLFSLSRQNAASTRKESPAGCWCCCFRRRKPSSGTKRHLQHNAREPSETEVAVLAGKGANPAFKTLLFRNTEFKLAVRLYLLLAFKPLPNSFSSPLTKNHCHNSACESLTLILVYPF